MSSSKPKFYQGQTVRLKGRQDPLTVMASTWSTTYCGWVYSLNDVHGVGVAPTDERYLEALPGDNHRPGHGDVLSNFDELLQQQKWA